MNVEPAGGVEAILAPSFSRETSCFNHDAFQFFLAREVAEANRYGYFAAFVLFRLEPADGGDALRRLVETLSRNIRGTDYLGILSESKVGLILQHATVESAERALLRLRGELKLVFAEGNGTSLSDACSVFPTDANTLEGLRASVESRLEPHSG